MAKKEIEFFVIKRERELIVCILMNAERERESV